MSQGLHMNPQLVTAAGGGLKCQPGGIVIVVMTQHAETCPAGLARFEIDFLARPVRPVADQGQINLPVLTADMSIDDGDVVFLHPALLEQFVHHTLGRFANGKYQYTRRFHVQAVDTFCLRPVPARP